jgi:ribosomal protein S18 acetylase RimI-like enzyme
MKAELRPTSEDDRDFLFRLYASTRLDEIAPFAWPAEQQIAFLRMQFNAQQRWYQTAHPGAEYKIIVLESQPIGRMVVLREQASWRLIDISLLPEHRAQGIGGELICSLISESSRAGAALKLQVLNSNPARRLYERLGFVSTAQDQIYTQMELRPIRRAGD